MTRFFILVDVAGTAIDDAAFELATMARTAPTAHLTAVLLGSGIEPMLPKLTPWFDEVVRFDDPRLDVPDGDFAAAVLTPFLRDEAPDFVLAAHTNYTMDFVPALAVRLGRSVVTDCLSVDLSGDTPVVVRPEYGGRIHARVALAHSAAGYLLTVRPGAVRAGTPPDAGGTTREENVPADLTPRRRYVETVAGDAGEVDISLADRLVAVGRGLEESDDLELIQELADALGAEVGCSRPVVDKQWMPKSRQVGTSGKTIKPSLYVAVGISGSFQHVGGVKGDPFVVAINKDPKAPIFSIADVGVVGDLYDIVPELIERIQALKD